MTRKNMRTRRKKIRRGGMLTAVRKALNGCVGRTCRARLAGRNNEEKEENAARLAENAETRARIDAAAERRDPFHQRALEALHRIHATNKALFKIAPEKEPSIRQVERLVDMTGWSIHDINPEVVVWLNKLAEEAEAIAGFVEAVYMNRRHRGEREVGEWRIDMARTLAIVERATEATATATTLDVAMVAARGAASGRLVARVAQDAAQDAAWAVERARNANAAGADTIDAIFAADDAIEEAREASYHERLSGSGSAIKAHEEKEVAYACAARALIACAKARALVARVKQRAEQPWATYWERRWEEDATRQASYARVRNSGKWYSTLGYAGTANLHAATPRPGAAGQLAVRGAAGQLAVRGATPAPPPPRAQGAPSGAAGPTVTAERVPGEPEANVKQEREEAAAVAWARGRDTPHQVLGVAEGTESKDIRRAYRRLLLEHHPDRGGNPQIAKRIITAYETLFPRGVRELVD